MDGMSQESTNQEETERQSPLGEARAHQAWYAQRDRPSNAQGKLRPLGRPSVTPDGDMGTS